jgi:hypothetical protein
VSVVLLVVARFVEVVLVTRTLDGGIVLLQPSVSSVLVLLRQVLLRRVLLLVSLLPDVGILVRETPTSLS